MFVEIIKWATPILLILNVGCVFINIKSVKRHKSISQKIPVLLRAGIGIKILAIVWLSFSCVGFFMK